MLTSVSSVEETTVPSDAEDEVRDEVMRDEAATGEATTGEATTGKAVRGRRDESRKRKQPEPAEETTVESDSEGDERSRERRVHEGQDKEATQSARREMRGTFAARGVPLHLLSSVFRVFHHLFLRPIISGSCWAPFPHSE